jgi:hypothetical protein
MTEEKAFDINEVAFIDMVSTLVKPGKDILVQATAVNCNTIHMAIGLAGEALELLDAQFRNKSNANIIEELGDLEFFVEGMYLAIGVERIRPLDLSVLTQEACYQELAIIAGDVLDTCKREFIYGKDLDVKTLVRALIEIDVILNSIYAFRHITMTLVQVANKQKLAARYKKFAYTDEQAINRNDKKEGDE